VKNGEKPIANPFVVLREEFDDWAVLFNPDSGHGFGLNPTGVYLWKMFDGKHTTEEMLTVLRQDALKVPADAGTHIDAFIEELTHHDMVVYEIAKPAADATNNRPHPPKPIPRPETGKMPYQPPTLIDFQPPAAVAYGACSNGSVTYSSGCANGTNTGASYYCKTGSTAPAGCSHTGASAQSLGCFSNGTVASGLYHCMSGGTPS
jgi:SynChlorMet cassette protein ScmD